MWWLYIPALVGYAMGLLVIPFVLIRKISPSSTMAWIFAIIFLPYIGTFLFLIFGRKRSHRKIKARLKKRSIILKELRQFSGPSETGGHKKDWLSGLQDEDSRLADLINLSINVSERQLVQGNNINLFDSAEKTYASMLADIEKAENHINILYYIFKTDEAGRRFRDALINKAKQGVTVNFLYDFIGSWDLSNAFLEPMRQAGIKCVPFHPVNLLVKLWTLNHRNHRKIIVIDGECGYTGGMNIGDEYVGRLEKYGPWRDSHMRIEGPAIDQLQDIFVDDWFYATGEKLAKKRYFPKKEPIGEHIIQVIPSGPEDAISPIHHIIFEAIMIAARRIDITAAYFIPDEPISAALQAAALRGVEVRIIVPARNDSRIFRMASRTYFEDLLAAGVRIFEYQKGILHAKCIMVDEIWGSVGSANMDTRSFWLNYEVNAFVYGKKFARSLGSVFEKNLKDSKEVALETVQSGTMMKHLAEGACRLFSPYL